MERAMNTCKADRKGRIKDLGRPEAEAEDLGGPVDDGG